MDIIPTRLSRIVDVDCVSLFFFFFFKDSLSPLVGVMGRNCYIDALPPERPSAVTTVVASRDSTAGISARVSRYQNPEMTRSPPVVYVDDEVSRKSGQTVLRK